jgi:putative nucleotidyltransferase with HDIG domain
MTSATPSAEPKCFAPLLRRMAAHHAETRRHCHRVAALAALLAARLGPDAGAVESIRNAGLLHDIGKLAIPVALLDQPNHLTNSERACLQRHTQKGASLLARIGGQAVARDVALSHHEHWDGSGYPFGLQGQAIPLAARIVSLANVYDALRSRRAYKEGRTHREVLATMINMHRQFDPQLLTQFLAMEASVARAYEKAAL